VCDDPDNDEFPPGCQPDRVGSPLYTHDPFFLDSGGVHINSGIANKAAYLLAEPGTKTFNGRNVTGIGLDKSVHLWYRVMLGITSGGDYEDLGHLLAQTCRRLAGNLGFTLADCVEVDDAVAATEMINTRADGTIEADLCPSGGQPINAIFSDDMERGSTKWVRTAGAQIIPSSQVPLRWAHSGIRAMYLPPTASMTMTNFVPIPASGTTYLWFAHNPFTGLPRLALNNGTTTTQVTFGSNWNLPGGSRTGWVPSDLSTGYVSTRFQLSSFAGQNLKVSFVEDPVIVNGQAFGEWLVDDVLIYQCANRVGTVGNLAGPRDASRTAATLSWTAPPFPGPGLAGYEVAITPSLPGYPVTLPAGALSHTITGLNPNRRYSVTVRAIGTDAVMGAPAVLPLDLIRACYVLHVPDNPLWTCPFVPRKPMPFG
jgi:hypothetical protein